MFASAFQMTLIGGAAAVADRVRQKVDTATPSNNDLHAVDIATDHLSEQLAIARGDVDSELRPCLVAQTLATFCFQRTLADVAQLMLQHRHWQVRKLGAADRTVVRFRLVHRP